MHQQVRSSRLWDTAVRLRLDKPLSELYWSLKLHREQQSCTQTVGDVSAVFTTTTRAEYLRIDEMVGERTVLETFVHRLQPDDVVYDIGMNTGLYACFAVRCLESGTVVGFEPEPANRRRAATNLAQNAQGTAYTVLPMALYDSGGTAELQVTGGLGDGQHQLDDTGGEETVTVATRRAASFLETGEYPVPDVVKIDVEGAERRVLDGFGEYLSEVRVVICEVHSDEIREFGDTAAAVEQRLTEAGFETEVVLERGDDYHVLATSTQ